MPMKSCALMKMFQHCTAERAHDIFSRIQHVPFDNNTQAKDDNALRQEWTGRAYRMLEL